MSGRWGTNDWQGSSGQSWSSSGGWNSRGSRWGGHDDAKGWDGAGWKSARDAGVGKGGRGGRGRPPSLPKLIPSLDAAKAKLVGELRVAFCPDPATSGGRFTSTFEESPSSTFASLNAGDEGFMVGGATMNLQFAKDLQTFGGQQPKAYRGLHTRLFADAVEGRLVTASDAVLEEDPNLCAAYVRVIQSGKKVGVVFIDVFKDLCRPHHTKNVAMVYTVGPQRSYFPSDEAFLAEVQAMAANVSATCCEYNASAPDPLETLRVCLVSGGAFAGGVNKADVACAIYLGLAEGLCDERHPQFEFSYDGDVFRSVWGDIEKLRTAAA